MLPLQPIAAHSYVAVLVRGKVLKIPPIAAHCSPLLHGNFSQGGYFLRNPPIAAQLLHHFTPPHRQITPPPRSYNKMGGFQGGHSTRVAIAARPG